MTEFIQRIDPKWLAIGIEYAEEQLKKSGWSQVEIRKFRSFMRKTTAKKVQALHASLLNASVINVHEIGEDFDFQQALTDPEQKALVRGMTRTKALIVFWIVEGMTHKHMNLTMNSPVTVA